MFIPLSLFVSPHLSSPLMHSNSTTHSDRQTMSRPRQLGPTILDIINEVTTLFCEGTSFLTVGDLGMGLTVQL